MIIVAQTELGVLFAQALNTVHAINLAEDNGVHIGDAVTYNFPNQDKIFNEIVTLISHKRINDHQFQISNATYQFILDKLDDNI